MSEICAKLHGLFNHLPRERFPWKQESIPRNGIYVLFEKGESAHGTDRIVRIGTHTGKDQLPSRLQQHFTNENKDRSVFRKNIGRAMLNKKGDEFLKQWEVDLTTRKSKKENLDKIDSKKQQRIEKEVSKYLQQNLTFVTIPVADPSKRLELESKIISTISMCQDCKPSSKWLGLHSPKDKIKESGLWLVNELYKEPLDSVGLRELERLA